MYVRVKHFCNLQLAERGEKCCTKYNLPLCHPVLGTKLAVLVLISVPSFWIPSLDLVYLISGRG